MLEASSYLRLALMFGENKASTFRKNLEKMITLVIYDKYESRDGLTVVDIINDIKDKYTLEFSDAEIIDVISYKKQNRIIQINDGQNGVQNIYSITPEEYNKIKEKTDVSSIMGIIDLFIKTKDVDVTQDVFYSLLIKFLYDVFNSNAEIILALMQGDHSKLEPINTEYSANEKQLINRFINWDNAEKNKCIFQLISCCFDYCMMTVRKDKKSYQTIFKKKKFYLDTNIVYRLMGLNNESRRLVINAFLEKCKEVGIQIIYTNHTKKELEDTIDYHVNQIATLFDNKEPLSVDAMNCLYDKTSNSDFYSEYVEWAKNSVNKVGDYIGFGKDLKRKAYSVLASFNQVTFDDYSMKGKSEFSDQFESLKTYKENNNKNVYVNSIRADINNYLYIQERNKENKGEDFFSINHYIITADHAFSNWEREKRPGTIPTVILPSVWYSIILQYAGRSEDDYTSFSRFLNFSVSENETTNKRKIEILKYVLDLNEPVEIKEKTIYDISSKLQGEYKNLDDEEMVKRSHEYVVNELISEVKEESKAEMAKVRNQLENDFNLKMNKQEEAYRETLNDLAEEKAHIEKKASEKEEQAKLDERNRIIEIAAKKKAKHTQLLYIVITIILICGLLASYFLIDKWIASFDVINAKTQLRYENIMHIMELLYMIIVGVIFTKVFHGCSRNKIYQSIITKLNDEFDD